MPLTPPPLAPPMLAAPWPARPESGVLLMGIVNVTPDSFSDGGHFAAHEMAIAQGAKLAQEGAHILDIGGESTRPGATFVPAEDEQARILPVIAGLRTRLPSAVISVDTYKAETARAALDVGANIVNDVWGLQYPGAHDADAMAQLVAQREAGLVIMHNRLERDERIDIVADMERFFSNSLARADAAGIDHTRIALDPGIGFGKTFEQNLAAIRALPQLKRIFGLPILLGVSRKGFLGLITGRPVDQRMVASVAVGVQGMLDGADILRVHDVAAHRDAAFVIAALRRAKPET